MIRIAHLFDTTGPGGAETVLVTLARGLDPERFQSVLCVRRNSWMHKELSGGKFPFHFLNDAGAFDLSFLRGLVSFIKNHHIDLVHSHDFFMNFYGTMAAKTARIPCIATIHGQAAYSAAKVRRRLAYRLVSRTANLITVSNQVAERFHKEVGISRKRMLTIYNGIEVEPFCNGESIKPLRDELKLHDRIPVIGMVGNLYPVKGYPYFIQAMELVKKQYHHAKFIICGRGKLQNELELLARNCGLSDAIQFLGFRHDVPRLLQLMDVFVLSSLIEGLSLSILEAMAAAKPVVVTDVGGNREIVVDGETGYLVPPQDPHAIAEKVCLLLSDRKSSEEMGRKGRQRVNLLFSKDTMIKNYQDLYTRLVRDGQVSHV